MTDNTEVLIYDTTLRDGTQGERVNFSAEEKLRIAQRLDEMGFHYIEGGWPGSNPKDMRFFELGKRMTFKHARLAAFGSTPGPISLLKSAKTSGRSWRHRRLPLRSSVNPGIFMSPRF